MTEKARILLVEPNAFRAETLLERFKTWYPDLEIDIAASEAEATQWRRQNRGITCDHTGAITLIELAMAAEDQDRDRMMDIARLEGDIRNLTERIGKLAHAIEGNGGKGIKEWVETMADSLYGDLKDIDHKPGLIAAQRDTGKDVKRILWWGGGITMLIIGALTTIILRLVLTGGG